jgi:hypothetical protein
VVVSHFSQVVALRSELQSDLHEVKSARWFTCTPVPFGGGPDFFARDSGLLCRAFQSFGVESHAVMPGKRQPGDEPDLIRADYRQLESAAWWKDLRLDGVVLYAWGRPKFRKVAKAIHEAGIFLVLNQDNGGLVSPLTGPIKWLKEQWVLAGGGREAGAASRFLKLSLRGLSVGLFLTDPLRASHLKQGDVIACVSPMAARHYRRLCWVYGGKALAARVTVIPHAVEPLFRYSGLEKRRQIACLGRWDDEVQKRPRLLMATVGSLLRADSQLEVAIAGRTTPDMETWRAGLPPDQADRVRLLGNINRADLARLLEESQVFYSPSAFESFGIAAGEALCAGCSVVAERSLSMAAFEWFVSANSGTLAEGGNAAAHVRALQTELDAWANGARAPADIARYWEERLHAPQVAAKILAQGLPKESVTGKF